MVCTLKHLSLCPEMEALYLFNPENDMALACGDPYYMAPASARRMAAELSMLPAWYAEEGGTVWLDSAQRMKTMERQSFLPLSVNWVLDFFLFLALFVVLDGGVLQANDEQRGHDVSTDHDDLPLCHAGVQVLSLISAAVDHGVEDVLGRGAHCLLAAVGQNSHLVEVIAGGAEHQIAAVADALISGHVAVDTEVVGLDEAEEAPLTAQDVLQQLLAAASPAAADVVEGRHDSVAVSILDRHLEGLEVDLADSLLVGPGSQHRSTVAFLIVQGEVLHVSVDAVLLCACDGVCGHSTGQDTVLRVVLEVTACKSGAVDVHCRAIPAGRVHLVGHLADAVAEVVCQIFAPSHADEGSSRETDRADAGEVVVDGRRAVTVEIGRAHV